MKGTLNDIMLLQIVSLRLLLPFPPVIVLLRRHASNKRCGRAQVASHVVDESFGRLPYTEYRYLWYARSLRAAQLIAEFPPRS